MLSKAIVLSGGGSVGVAWQTGVCAGLFEQGVSLSDAELIVGTSAGSAVGAQIALGRDLQEAMQRFVRVPASDAPKAERAAAPDRPAGAAAVPAAVPAATAAPGGSRLQPLLEVMAKAMQPGSDPKSARAQLGRFALEARTPPEESFLRGFEYLAGASWPSAFRCTAVDCESGEFMVWSRSSGATLQAAVASSCAVPGLFPPITIAGRRYMDGGMRSGTNADLAKGAERVLVLTLMGTSSMGGSTDGVAGGDARMQRMQRNLERELSGVRAAGGRAELLGPDAEAAAIMGFDLMNPRLAYDAAQAGLRQGRHEAERVRAFFA